MRRIERVIGEARMLRIRRAARAQSRAAEGRGRDDGSWLEEIEASSRILRDLSQEGAAPSAHPSTIEMGEAVVRRPVDVFDVGVLGPFMDDCMEALDAVVAKHDPHGRLFLDLFPKICAFVAPGMEVVLDPKERAERERAERERVERERAESGRHAESASPESSKPEDAKPGSDDEEPQLPWRDQNRARRAAVEDVCVLAVEGALFEVVKRFQDESDLKRRLSAQSDAAGIQVFNGKVRRPKAMAKEAARRNAAKHFANARKALEERKALESGKVLEEGAS